MRLSCPACAKYPFFLLERLQGLGPHVEPSGERLVAAKLSVRFRTSARRYHVKPVTSIEIQALAPLRPALTNELAITVAYSFHGQQIPVPHLLM